LNESSDLLVTGSNSSLNSNVEVLYNDIVILITVNHRYASKTNKRTVKLSDSAAKKLKIEKGSNDCIIHIPVYKNCILLRTIVKILPFIDIIISAVLFKQIVHF